MNSESVYISDVSVASLGPGFNIKHTYFYLNFPTSCNRPPHYCHVSIASDRERPNTHFYAIYADHRESEWVRHVVDYAEKKKTDEEKRKGTDSTAFQLIAQTADCGIEKHIDKPIGPASRRDFKIYLLTLFNGEKMMRRRRRVFTGSSRVSSVNRDR